MGYNGGGGGGKERERVMSGERGKERTGGKKRVRRQG